jgi:thiol-disulfide isomerase/thioredoxin
MTQRLLGIISIAILGIIVLASVLWYAFYGSHQLKSASQAPVVGKAALGQRAPQFVVATTQGPFDLNKSTKPVFLEIFATWCPHCQRETAVIDKLYAEYKSRVDFVGVSGSDTAMDGTSPASQLDVIQWVDRFHVDYPVAYDSTQSVAQLYLQGGFPTLVVIGTNKQVAYINSGEISYAELKTAIDHAL